MRATTRYLRMTHRGAFEDEVALHLRRAGLKVSQQFPCGPYNLDIIVHEPPIAVEISSSTCLPKGPSLFKRTNRILDCGWHVVYVYARKPPFNGGKVADHILAYIDSVRRKKPVKRGRYWMIWGNGEVKP